MASGQSVMPVRCVVSADSVSACVCVCVGLSLSLCVHMLKLILL